MPIKVFISHQQQDSVLAGSVAYRLKAHHQIDSYLDLIDPNVRRGEDLAAHLRAVMGTCTQLLAVVSAATRESQWVPWEIGVATEKNFPLATYSSSMTPPPEFLRKWPYLRSDADLDTYARISKQAEQEYRNKSVSFSEGYARSQATAGFFSSLRSALGQ
ncbi:toll/interleukin-1 receptor domain-containing protein [uncultured Sphingomonas sp.]|uniref:toll/interleukin-1 receptor domain-containing protein n=1 Tax=uncultured Sphingomonas sp. TaxID=158754 RepID=UPI0025F819BE|nr:toll/interleukin-1 receptor domain-containing protein [uncultured Sphingomonas sp.]